MFRTSVALAALLAATSMIMPNTAAAHDATPPATSEAKDPHMWLA